MAEINHHIQREIIDRLMRAKTVRFKDLKPDGMESNIFMYHLNQLIKQNYVAKTESGYTLAVKGLRYADNLTWMQPKPLPQPKNICIFAINNEKDQWMLVERKLQPFIGAYMLPSSKQQYGVSVERYILSSLKEDFDIKAPISRRGTAEIILYDDDSRTLLTHVIGQVYSLKLDSSAKILQTDKHNFIWTDDLDSLDLLPGTKELIENLENSKDALFFTYKNI